MACSIDKDFLHIKMVYFSYLGAFACMLPYISVYFIHIGLSVWQVGTIRSLDPILTFICSPLWGAVSDKFSKHRLATSIAISGAGVVYFTFIFVPLMTGVSPDSLVQDVAERCPQNGTQWNNYHKMCDGAASVDQHGVQDDAGWTNESVECTDLCSAAIQAGSHGDDENRFALCFRGDEGWNCNPCPRIENHHTEDIPKGTVTLYSLSCGSRAGYSLPEGSPNVTESATVASVVPQIERNFSRDFCLQSSCCQCLTKDIPNPRQGATFAICIFFAILGVAFNCNILMFFDAITMELLKGRRADYGKNRMWGAISWGVFALLSGVAIDVYTDKINARTDRLEPAFIMYLIGMLICLAIFLHMKLPDHKKPEAMKKNLQAILCDGKVILFLFVVVVTGISFILTYTFVFIFMKELDSPYMLLGLAVTLTAVAEIPFMYFSGAIIKRVGYAGVMYMTLCAYAVRYFSYSFVYNPWFILPVQLLHGITYGLAWPMFTAFANSSAPKGMATTLQSIVACCFMGVGAGVGSFVGGIVYENYGARVLFRCNGGLCLVTLIIFFFFTVFVLKKKEGKNVKDEDGENVPEKCNMKDAPVDAINWDDVEKNENIRNDEEVEGLVEQVPSLDEEKADQNNTNVDIHLANI